MKTYKIEGKSLKKILIQLILVSFFIMATSAIIGLSFAQSDDVDVFIDGDDIAQTNSTGKYVIKIVGGPAEQGGNFSHWSYEAWLEDEDGDELRIEDGSVVPDNGTSRNNIFNVSVIMPNREMKIKLVVNGTSTLNETNVSWSGEVFQEIKVFEPIIVNITANVRNPSIVDANDVMVSFYVFHEDGSSTFVGNRTVDVPANSTKEVSMDWVASKELEGEHEVEIRINEDGTLLEFDNQDNVIRIPVYVGKPPERESLPIMAFNFPGLVFLIGFFGFLFLLAGFFMWRNTIRGRGYYSERSTYAMYFEGVLMVVFSVPILYVSQILAANPDVEGDPVTKMVEGVVIFIFGFLTLLLNWDRNRKKRR